jgi:hypothetical protein
MRSDLVWGVVAACGVVTIWEMLAIQSAWARASRADLDLHTWICTPTNTSTVLGDAPPFTVQWELFTPSTDCYFVDKHTYPDWSMAQRAVNRRIPQTVFEAASCDPWVHDPYCMTESEWESCRQSATTGSILFALLAWPVLWAVQAWVVYFLMTTAAPRPALPLSTLEENENECSA